MLYGKALLNVSIMENEVWLPLYCSLFPKPALYFKVLGNALDGMELEDDSKSLPQVVIFNILRGI